MLDGKTFFPVTGTPIRKIACMISPLALAEPVPLAVAILNAKSFVWFIKALSLSGVGRRESALPSAFCLVPFAFPLSPDRLQRNKGHARVRLLQHEPAHVPGVGRAALGAQAAVQADVLVLHHHPARLLQRPGDE